MRNIDSLFFSCGTKKREGCNLLHLFPCPFPQITVNLSSQAASIWGWRELILPRKLRYQISIYNLWSHSIASQQEPSRVRRRVWPLTSQSLKCSLKSEFIVKTCSNPIWTPTYDPWQHKQAGLSVSTTSGRSEISPVWNPPAKTWHFIQSMKSRFFFLGVSTRQSLELLRSFPQVSFLT